MNNRFFYESWFAPSGEGALLSSLEGPRLGRQGYVWSGLKNRSQEEVPENFPKLWIFEGVPVGALREETVIKPKRALS